MPPLTRRRALRVLVLTAGVLTLLSGINAYFLYPEWFDVNNWLPMIYFGRGLEPGQENIQGHAVAFFTGIYRTITEYIDWDRLPMIEGVGPRIPGVCDECVEETMAPLVVGPPRKSLSFPNGASSSAGTHSSIGSMHLVEYFEFYDRDQPDDGSPYFNFGRRMHWRDFSAADHLMVLPDEDLTSRGVVRPIEEAHGSGQLHKGVWIAVLRGVSKKKFAAVKAKAKAKANASSSSAARVLLLRRGASLKTCPGAWGLVGEHLEPGESWGHAVGRALEEELSLNAATSSRSSSSRPSSAKPVRRSQMAPLVDGSLLVRIPYPMPAPAPPPPPPDPSPDVDYGIGVYHSEEEIQNMLHPSTPFARKDLQATGVWVVLLSPEQAAAVTPDEEAVEYKWATAEEAAALLVGSPPHGRAPLSCTSEIAELAAWTLAQLEARSLLPHASRTPPSPPRRRQRREL